MEEKDMVKVKEYVEEENRGLSKRRQTGTQLYSICRKTSYNIRIYLDTKVINSLSNSE